MSPMIEGKVDIETEMIQVDIKMLEMIGICVIGRD